MSHGQVVVGEVNKTGNTQLGFKPFFLLIILIAVLTQTGIVMRRSVVLVSAFFLFNLTSCATRAVASPAKVTVIKKAPSNYKIVTVKGKRYYYWNGKHYKKTRRGFVLVKL